MLGIWYVRFLAHSCTIIWLDRVGGNCSGLKVVGIRIRLIHPHPIRLHWLPRPTMLIAAPSLTRILRLRYSTAIGELHWRWRHCHRLGWKLGLRLKVMTACAHTLWEDVVQVWPEQVA